MTMKAQDLQSSIAEAANVRMYELDLLDDNPIQPELRTASVKHLRNDITDSRAIVPIVGVLKRTRITIIDGHRRAHAARELGLAQVPVMLLTTGLPVTVLFLLFNRSTARITAQQYYECWAKEHSDDRGAFLHECPRATRTNILAMVEIFGASCAVDLADGRLSPHISRFINLANNLIVGKGLEAPPINVIGHWLIKHKQSDAINKMARNPSLTKRPVEALLNAITADRKLHNRA